MNKPTTNRNEPRNRVGSRELVRLSAVTLTKSQAEVFFNMLAMNAAEPTDVDYKEQSALHAKFTKARKPNGELSHGRAKP